MGTGPGGISFEEMNETFLDRLCFAFYEPVLVIFLSTRNRGSIAAFKNKDSKWVWLKARSDRSIGNAD